MSRGILTAGVAAAMLTAGVAPAPPAAAGRSAWIDPALAASLAHGPVPALLWWDGTRATREDVADYLEASGIQAYVFERLSGALVCATALDVTRVVARAPGAIAVWGDRPLTPATHDSIPTAFAGDPAAVWGGGVTGKGIGIAVVDTGVDATHPDLRFGIRTKLNVRVVVSSRDILQSPGDPCVVLDIYSDQLEDSELTSGHGTHIAGVAAGDGTASAGWYRGMAPEADVVGVGVADTLTPEAYVEGESVDRDTRISMLGTIAGINYVLVNAVDGPTLVKVILAGWTQEGLYHPLNPVGWAISNAAAWGISVVVPAGNEGPQPSDCSSAGTCRINVWAASPYTIAVAATPKRSRTDLEPYSSRGDPIPREALWETVRYEPTLAAPGTGVVAARRPGLAPYLHAPASPAGAEGDGDLVVFDRRYVGMTGTSIAAAHVAGAIALMQQSALEARGCYLLPDQVKEILVATATPMQGHGTWEVGAGALNATAAVVAARYAPIPQWVDEFICPLLGG